jgi:uncharacterized GH25 family protein
MRCVLSLACLVLAAVPAPAHFIWIVPDGLEAAAAKVVFSEDLQPDDAVPIERIAATKISQRDAAGKVTPLETKKGDHAYLVGLPGTGASVVGGVCEYGVLQRGDSKPFLLAYYPKFVRGEVASARPWDMLPLEIVALGADRYQVLFRGKPAAGAEVVVLAPGAKEKETIKAGAEGEFKTASAARGLYGIRARHIEARAGELGGKKYEEVRHYATLVFQNGAK